MNCRRFFLVMAFAVSGSQTIAADVNHPEALAVVNAMYAAVGVGNVDAAVSFFADDGYNIGPGGKKIAGRDQLRTVMRDLWIPENVQITPGHLVGTRGGASILSYDIITEPLAKPR